jgi:hypothetical protein
VTVVVYSILAYKRLEFFKPSTCLLQLYQVCILIESKWWLLAENNQTMFFTQQLLVRTDSDSCLGPQSPLTSIGFSN